MCLENHWDTGWKKKPEKSIVGTSDSCNQLWAFHLVPPPCSEQNGLVQVREFQYSQRWHLREVGVQLRPTRGTPDGIFFRGWGRRLGGPLQQSDKWPHLGWAKVIQASEEVIGTTVSNCTFGKLSYTSCVRDMPIHLEVLVWLCDATC